MTSSSVGAWRLAALQLLGAAERFIRHDGEPHTATVQLSSFERFRERVAMLRSQVEELEGDRVEFMPDWVHCDLVRNPRPDWVVVDEVSTFQPEVFDRVRRAREDRARREWMHAAGMV